jgi:hypothetical protein
MTISAEKLSAQLAAMAPAAQAAVGVAKMLPDMIQAAEAAIGPGNGTVKLDLVKTWVSNTLAKAQMDIPLIEAVWAKLEPLVSVLVTIFTKSPAIASLLALTVKAPAAAVTTQP